MFSADQLATICPHCKDPGAVAANLNNAMVEFGVTDHAMFVAQLAHESGEFRYVREIASGLAYEGRADLGNDEEGDGRRYKGRGYLQITGKANYRACGDALDLDLLGHPELLELPVLSARSAGWYWKSRKLNGRDLLSCTRKINGGTNGLESRRKYYLRAREVLGLQDPAPVEERTIVPISSVVAAVLPTILSAAPDLLKIFSDKPEKDAPVAAVLEIAKEVTGAINEQAAAEKLQEPALRQAFQQAIQDRWFELVAVGGGVTEARQYASASNGFGNPALWVTAALLPLVYLVVYAVLFNESTEELRAMVVTAIVSGVLGAITGFWMGTSFGSQRKTDMIGSGK